MDRPHESRRCRHDIHRLLLVFNRLQPILNPLTRHVTGILGVLQLAVLRVEWDEFNAVSPSVK